MSLTFPPAFFFRSTRSPCILFSCLLSIFDKHNNLPVKIVVVSHSELLFVVVHILSCCMILKATVASSIFVFQQKGGQLTYMFKGIVEYNSLREFLCCVMPSFIRSQLRYTWRCRRSSTSMPVLFCTYLKLWLHTKFHAKGPNADMRLTSYSAMLSISLPCVSNPAEFLILTASEAQIGRRHSKSTFEVLAQWCVACRLFNII